MRCGNPKDTDNQRNHGKRHHIYTHERMCHHDRGNNWKRHDDDKQQSQRTVLLVIITPEQLQVNHETAYQQRHEKQLPKQSETLFCNRLASFVPFFLQRPQNIICMTVYNFASVDNFLTIHDKTVGPRQF